MSVLGIHTECNSNKDLRDHHAWITYEKEGVTRSFGLYKDEAKQVIERGQEKGWDGSGTHVRESCEGDRNATASRFQTLTPEQATKFEAFLEQKQTWTREYNCAHWARDAWHQSTGEQYVLTHQFPHGNQTRTWDLPDGLEQSIRERRFEQDVGTLDKSKDMTQEPTAAFNQQARKSPWFEDNNPSALNHEIKR